MSPSALRPRQEDSEEGPHSPEALTISAMLETGLFIPETYYLTEDHPACYNKLWSFCCDYQQRTGSAPSRELVKGKFADFVFTPNVDPGWAAGELRKAAALRQLRETLMTSLRAINDEDLDEAFNAVESISRPRGHRKDPTSILDHQLLEEERNALSVDVPFHTLPMLTGGIRSSEMWLLAARPWTGKSMLAVEFLKAATKQGFHVRWYTLEMPKRQVARRVWSSLAGRDMDLRRKLLSEDIFENKEALDELAAKLPVVPTIVDRKDGPITAATIREGLEEVDLVILDHINLLKTATGQRLVEDSRLVAATSNQLREDVLATDGRLLAIAHVNRQGVNNKFPPKLEEIAESDWLARDPDVVVTMSRPSDSVAVYGLPKNREGKGGKWYSRFDPDNSRFEELRKENAEDLIAIDEDRQHN